MSVMFLNKKIYTYIYKCKYAHVFRLEAYKEFYLFSICFKLVDDGGGVT